jgi:hypothetical protein
MSYGVMKSGSSTVRIPLARTKIALTSLENYQGLTLAGGSVSFADLGTYFFEVQINVVGNNQDMPFRLELYNETLAALVQSRDGVAPQQGLPSDLWYGFNFDVTNVLHTYSFYLTPLASAAPTNNAVSLIGQNLRVLVTQLSRSGESVYGDGSDGDIIYDTVDGRWEDGAGVALATVAGKWTVAGVLLTLRRNFQFGSVTVANGATLQSGLNESNEYFHHKVKNRMQVNNGGLVRAGYSGLIVQNGRNGGAQQIAAAVGNDGVLSAAYAGALALATPLSYVMGAGGGLGGDAAVNIGGISVNFRDPAVAFVGYGPLLQAFDISGVAPVAVPDTRPTNLGLNAPLLPGIHGAGGGGGGMDLGGARTASLGGAGGAGGQGGGAMRWDIYDLVVIFGGEFEADGAAGAAGADGVATDVAGDISGGGGGGGGGSGGTIILGFHAATFGGNPWDRNLLAPAYAGYVHCEFGAAGAGGLGYEFDDVLRAAADGAVGVAANRGPVVLGILS